MEFKNKQKGSVLPQEEEQHSSKTSDYIDVILVLTVLEKLLNVIDKFGDMHHMFNGFF